MNDFQIGEHVKVFGNDTDLFEVVGYNIKKYHAFGRSTDETMVTLKELKTGITMEIHKSFVIKEKISTDELLDQYINYMTLFDLFKDENYKISADKILEKLKTVSQR